MQISDTILISLGLKTAEMSEKQKKERAKMYDTNIMDDEDNDYFDRTIIGKTKAASLSRAKGAGEVEEFADLPRVGNVENKETLEKKVKQLNAERAHMEAKVAMTEIAVAKYGSKAEEDDLDAFMKGNEQSLVTERLAKLKRRQSKVLEFLEEAKKMLAIAQRNSDGDQSVASALAANAAGAAARKVAAAAAKAAEAAAAAIAEQAAKKLTPEEKEAADKAALAERKRLALAALEAAAAPCAPIVTSKEDGQDSAAADAASGSQAPVAAAQPSSAEATQDAAKKLLLGKKIYGAAPMKSIAAGQGGLQVLAPAPASQKRKLGATPPPSDVEESPAQDQGPGPTPSPEEAAKQALAARKRAALEAADAASRAMGITPASEMRAPKRKVYGAMPPPAGAQAASAGDEADMPPPKKKMYGAMPPPSGQPNPPSRDSNEEFE